jgi:multiple sugar transport system substrate-binding protein
MKKYQLSLISLFLILSVFSGCEKSTSKTTIVFATWGMPWQTEIIREQVIEFEKRNPDIKIDLITTTYTSYHQKISTMMAGRESPDVFTIGMPFYLDLQNGDALLGLDNLMENDPEWAPEDIVQEFVDAFVVDDSVYAIPIDVSVKMIYYNKDIFDAAGLPYPDEEWTVQDFFDYAKKLTIDEDLDGIIDQYGCYFNPRINQVCTWLWLNGGAFLDETRTRCVINTPKNIATLEFLRDLYLKHRLTQRPFETGSPDPYFLRGKLAMAEGWPSKIAYYRKITEFSWDIVTFPKGSHGTKAQLSAKLVAISSKTKHKPEAWRFFKFLLSREVAEKMVKTGSGFPIKKSVAFSDALMNNPPPDNREAFLTSLKNGRYRPFARQWDRIQRITDDELALLWTGEKSLEQACKDIEEKVNAILTQPD